MHRAYRNPPLIEALCEFEFQAGQPWDWTVPGRIYERVRHEYPQRRERYMGDVESHRRQAQSDLARLIFLHQDERSAIQVGLNLLAVNLLKPNSDWATFRTMIEQALAVYTEVAQPAQIQRIGLRYIYRIVLPSLSEASRYVAFLPFVPEAIPHAPETWALRVDIPYSEQEYLRLQSAALIDTPAILLDIEFATVQRYNPQANDWLQWLERAHTVIEEAFEASITPVARESFGEEVHYE